MEKIIKKMVKKYMKEQGIRKLIIANPNKVIGPIIKGNYQIKNVGELELNGMFTLGLHNKYMELVNRNSAIVYNELVKIGKPFTSNMAYKEKDYIELEPKTIVLYMEML